METDILVVGCGIAGLSAAVAGASAGARVVVLERATPEEFGGNTRWTESYFRMKNTDEVSDDFEEQLAANAGSNLDPAVVGWMAKNAYDSWPGYVKAHSASDPELIATLAAQAGPTVRWLQSFGIKFDALPTYFLTAAAPRIMPVGGGLAMIETLRDRAVRLGVEIRYQTTAISLLRDERVGLGVRVANPDGQVSELNVGSVVLASGGFEGNPEMLARYLGPSSRHVRPVARGGYFNRGEGIDMGLDVGAAAAGDFSSYHAEPLDPRSAQTEPLVMSFPYGILVNKLGERFIDEAPGPVDLHYDPISRAIKDQPDGIAYFVFDQRIQDVPNWRKGIRTDKAAIEAPSLRLLAQLCSIDEAGLARTVDSYNRACVDGPFSPLSLDGLATQGCMPQKSNWARPIDLAPFAAYPIISGICFTYGGLKTNSLAQVIDGDGRCIPRLYAAGEAAGLYHQVYTGATSVMRGAVFGRIAGEHAAAACRGAH